MGDPRVDIQKKNDGEHVTGRKKNLVENGFYLLPVAENQDRGMDDMALSPHSDTKGLPFGEVGDGERTEVDNQLCHSGFHGKEIPLPTRHASFDTVTESCFVEGLKGLDGFLVSSEAVSVSDEKRNDWAGGEMNTSTIEGRSEENPDSFLNNIEMARELVDLVIEQMLSRSDEATLAQANQLPVDVWQLLV